MRLDGKVALVTGGALGMGASTAQLFAKEGAKVIVTDMLESEGQAVADGIVAANGAAVFQKHNVADEDEWQAAAKVALDTYGAIDILINNAGISGSDPDLLSRDVWDGQMNINATHLSRHAHDHSTYAKAKARRDRQHLIDLRRRRPDIRTHGI